MFSRERKSSKDLKTRPRGREDDQLDDFRPILREIFMMDYIIDPEVQSETLDQCLNRLLSL